MFSFYSLPLFVVHDRQLIKSSAFHYIQSLLDRVGAMDSDGGSELQIGYSGTVPFGGFVLLGLDEILIYKASIDHPVVAIITVRTALGIQQVEDASCAR